MAIINQLSGTDQLAAGDSVPVYSVAQGDTRRFTLSTLEAYMADANFVYRYFQTWAEFLTSDGWKDQDIFLVSAEDTGTHNSVAGDVGEAAGQTPNVGVFRYSIILTTGVRISDTDAQVAKYWADQAAASAAAALASAAAALVTLGDVNTAGTTQVAAVNTAGSTQVAAVTAEGTTQIAAVNSAGAIQTANAAAQVALATAQADLALTRAGLTPALTGVGTTDLATTTVGTTAPAGTTLGASNAWSSGRAFPYPGSMGALGTRWSASATMTVNVIDLATRKVLKKFAGIAVVSGVNTTPATTFGDYIRPANSALFIERTAGTGFLYQDTTTPGTAIRSELGLAEGAVATFVVFATATIAVSESVTATTKVFDARASALESLWDGWGETVQRTIGSTALTGTLLAPSTGSTGLLYLSGFPCRLKSYAFVASTIGAGFLDFMVMNRNGTATRWGTPVPVVVTAAGVQTVTLSVNLPANALVGYRAVVGAGVSYLAAAGQDIYHTATAAAVGSDVTLLSTTSRAAHSAVIEEPRNRKRRFPPRGVGKQVIVQEDFTGTTTPPGWTLGAAFSVSDGLVSTGTGGWNNFANFAPATGATSSISRRKHSARFTISAPTTIIALATKPGSGAVSTGYGATVDCVAGQLRLWSWNGGAAVSYVSSVALPASILTAISASATFDVQVDIVKDGQSTTCTATNPLNMESATFTETLPVVNDSAYRLGHGSLSIVHIQGTATTRRVVSTFGHPEDIATLILGDSNSEGIFSDSANSWGQQMVAASPNGRCVLSGRGGASATSTLLQLNDLLFFRPDRTVIALGGNQDAGADNAAKQATWRNKMAVLIDYAKAVGSKVFVTTLTPVENNLVYADLLNTDILAQYWGADVGVVDLGAPVSTSNARSTWQAGYKKDATHANQAGQNVMYAKLLADVPDALV